jgi:hypothetical protein
MKKTQEAKKHKVSDDMVAEYRFDYSKAKPNRFASQIDTDPLVVVLDSDVAQVFNTPDAVNNALRALISAMPKK